MIRLAKIRAEKTLRMEYKLHRVAPNSNGWVRPSPGRLGTAGVGEYVKENGFGHEDWNFNFSLASNGEMLGYTVAHPAARLSTEKFGVILATYDPQGWSAVGYYDGANFTTQTRSYDAAALQQMAVDVFELAERNHVAPKYRGMSLSEIEQIIEKELIYSCWVTPISQVFVFEGSSPFVVGRNVLTRAAASRACLPADTPSP
jgi:hypothetical protein